MNLANPMWLQIFGCQRHLERASGNQFWNVHGVERATVQLFCGRDAHVMEITNRSRPNSANNPDFVDGAIGLFYQSIGCWYFL